jgi:putative spermidine/putrescine transport system permease protein
MQQVTAIGASWSDGRAARGAERVLLWLLLACGLLLVFVPLVLTLYLSVFDETIILFPPRGYTLRWYAAILPQFGGALLTSLEVAIAAVIVSLALGVPAGIGLSRYRFRGRGAISTLLLAPLTVPGVAIGLGIYCLAVLFEENTGAPLTGGLWLLIAGHALVTLPWVVRLCLASLTNHERAAEEAAASLGARPLMVIWRVTLPAMRSGIAAGALFAFILSFENFDMSMFLVSPGVTTLPIAVLLYLQYHVDPLVAALAVAQIVVIGVALLLADRAVRLGAVLR